MPNDVVFDVKVDHWVAGCARFRGQLSRTTMRRWEDALDRTYEHTQSIVHVITGALKASGKKYLTFTADNEVRWAIVYGGPDSPKVQGRDPRGRFTAAKQVDYAFYEFRRGGTHDFMTPAVVANIDRFPEAMEDSFREVVSTWG